MASFATRGMVTSAPERVSSRQASIPGASFRLVPRAGHLPQLENPEAVLALFAEL
jgi:pimeloyl-ACP methyl ester carboxylesterase